MNVKACTIIPGNDFAKKLNGSGNLTGAGGFPSFGISIHRGNRQLRCHFAGKTTPMGFALTSALESFDVLHSPLDFELCRFDSIKHWPESYHSWCGKYIFAHSTDARVWIVSGQQRVCELRHIFAGNKAYLCRARMTRRWNRLASYGNSAMTEMERVSLSALAIWRQSRIVTIEMRVGADSSRRGDRVGRLLHHTCA